ncbi:unnamed protein product [[Candida] boidinii]|nr:unnamed protein product [[Candida] boidinii]GMF97661.1 unnamed protein product [[Candida] boidinii]
MSTASKVTLVCSTIFAVASTVGVYYLAENERDALKFGPIKDAERLAKRNLALNDKQKANLDDFELQKKLKEKLQSDQPLTGEIIQGLDKSK